MLNENYSNKIVIIGWNERARILIGTLNAISSAQISIIDSSVRELPIKSEKVELINGSPLYNEVLKEAGIQQAAIVIITADMHSNETDSDHRSILCLLTIKSLNPSIYVLIEILSEMNVKNAKRAGADQIIRTTSIIAESILEKFF